MVTERKMATHGYRSRPELFRDFLSAAKTGGGMSRILRMANLNQSSYSRYVRYCLQEGFLLERADGYELTHRAEEALSAVNLVLEKASELESALERYSSILGGTARERDRFLRLSERRLRAVARISGPGAFEPRFSLGDSAGPPTLPHSTLAGALSEDRPPLPNLPRASSRPAAFPPSSPTVTSSDPRQDGP